jgi:DNA-binding NarL/FixJ family response regulator
MNKSKKIKIVLAEDQELMRKSFISLLKEDKEFQVTGEASNGKELLELLKSTTPDIVLLDIEMPVMNGMEALSVMSKRFPDIRVIILSMYSGPSFIYEMMARGARAYLAKNCDAETLFEAIHTVYHEGFYFDKNVSEAMLKGLQREKSLNPILELMALSDREIEIVKTLCEGKTNKEIADTMNISENTVHYHRLNIYKKTKSRNITDLVKYAIKNGIIELT